MLVLRGVLMNGSPRRGRIALEAVLPGDSEQTQPGVEWQAEGSAWECRLPVVFPYRAKWAHDNLLIARLRITVLGEDESPLWSAQYPFGLMRV